MGRRGHVSIFLVDNSRPSELERLLCSCRRLWGACCWKARKPKLQAGAGIQHSIANSEAIHLLHYTRRVNKIFTTLRSGQECRDDRVYHIVSRSGKGASLSAARLNCVHVFFTTHRYSLICLSNSIFDHPCRGMLIEDELYKKLDVSLNI